MAPLVSTVLTGVRRQDVGAASGVMSTSIQLGNSLGVAFLGLVFFSILGSGVVRGATRPGSYADAFALTLIADAALALVGFLLVALLPQYRRPAATPVLLLTPDVHDATLERR